MDYAEVTRAALLDELEKIALLERLVRLGATDIPGTPRLFMKHRNPQELAGLQHGVDTFFRQKVQGPIEQFAEKGIQKLPGGVQGLARRAASTVAKNPEMLALEPVPVPGASMMYLAGKRGLERVIDRFAPAAQAADKLAVAHGRMTVPKTRAGRRSISVDKLLQKEKDSELYKSTGDGSKIARIVPFTETSPLGTGAKPRRPGDLPSRDDMDETAKREDRRGSATTLHAPGGMILGNTDGAP